MPLDLSIIIPVYNRVDLLKKYTLESVKRAMGDLQVEIILVDDGSLEPIKEELKDLSCLPIKYIRQENQGYLKARLAGLNQAVGKYILFLDSDDLVHSSKLVAQVTQMDLQGADVSYTDTATVALTGQYDSLVIRPDEILPVATKPSEFYLSVQPPPHGSIFLRNYLQGYLEKPVIPENRIFSSIGDVWMNYNLCIHPAKIIKVEGGCYALITRHNDKLSLHWERLAVASLALSIAFMRHCPNGEAALEAREVIGENAFNSWRRLPRGFDADFENRMLKVWKDSPKGPLGKLGGKKFQILASILGIFEAARIFRYFQRPSYSKFRTISNDEIHELVESLDRI